MSAPWPRASYFDDGSAWASQALAELELLDRADWRELYRRQVDGSYWRLDAADKYQQRFLIQLDHLDDWSTQDSSALEMELLRQHRGGLGNAICLLQGCNEPVLLGSAFCLGHTYERGVRK